MRSQFHPSTPVLIISPSFSSSAVSGDTYAYGASLNIPRSGGRWELYAGVPDTHPGDIFLNSLYKYGGMVWADATFSRFLLVNVYGPNLNGAKGRATTRTQLRNEYTDATLFHANRFLNLVTYLAGTPKWYALLLPILLNSICPVFLSPHSRRRARVCVNVWRIWLG